MRAANNNGITIAAGARRDAGWAGNVLQAMRDPPLMQASARAAPDRTRSANRSIGRCSGRFWLALGPGLRSHTLASAGRGLGDSSFILQARYVVNSEVDS